MKPCIFYKVFFLSFMLSIDGFAQFTKLNTGNIATDDDRSNWVSIADFDKDGHLDVVIGNRDEENFLYQGSNAGTFTKSSLDGSTNNTRSATWADYDNDGDLDLFYLNSNARPQLFRNNNDGTFTEMNQNTVEFLKNNNNFYRNAVWLDFNNDSHLDLYLSLANNSNDLLFINTGNNIDYSRVNIPTRGTVKSGTWADFDKDGDLDLFAATEGNNNAYFENIEGVLDNDNDNDDVVDNDQNSTNCAIGDYDNDGDLDLFLANRNFSLTNDFFRNDNGQFTRVSDLNINFAIAASNSSVWADFDNDGDLDLFIANGRLGLLGNNQLFYNDGDGTFTQQTTGLLVSENKPSRGVSIADINNDGLLDIVLATDNPNPLGNDRNDIFINDGNANNWIGLNLEGTVSNKFAIGAKVYLDSGNLHQYRELQPSNGTGGQNDYRLNFGLGANTSASVKIEWPSGIYQKLKLTTVNTYQDIIEPETPTITLRNALTGTAFLPHGSTKQVLYMFEIVATSAVSFSQLELEANGTFQNSDFVNNSVKLWYSTSNDLSTATEVAQTSIGNSFDFSFSDLNLISTTPSNTNYFWVTVDVSNTAVDGRFIEVTPRFEFDDFSDHSSFLDNTQEGDRFIIQNTSTPNNVEINSIALSNIDAQVNSTNHIIYHFQAQLNTSSELTLSEVNIQTQGTFINTDVTNFKFWRSNSDDFSSATAVKMIASVNNGDVLSFKDLDLFSGSGTTIGRTFYFWVTTDLSDTAIEGHTLQILSPSLDDFAISPSITKNGSLADGNILSIVGENTNPPNSSININSFEVEEQAVEVGSEDVITYQFEIELASNQQSLFFRQISFPTSGNFTTLDLEDFQLWYHTQDNLKEAIELSLSNAVNTGEKISFTDFNLNLIENRYYFWVTSNISPTASIGNNLQLNAPTVDSFVFSTMSAINENLLDGSNIIFIENNSNPITENPLQTTVFFPTVFTPNSDGKNDYFTLYAPDAVSVALSIWDRFGNLVYETNNLDEIRQPGWDGDNQPNGLYVWKVQLQFNDGQEVQQRGEIRLLR